MLAIGVLATEVVALVYIFIEALNNASTDVFVAGQMYLVATQVLAIIGSLVYALFIVMTAVIYCTMIGKRMSHQVSLLYRRSMFIRTMTETERDSKYKEFVVTRVGEQRRSQ